MPPCIFTLFFKSASLYFYPIFQKCILVFFPYFSKMHPCIFTLFFSCTSLFFPPIFQILLFFKNASLYLAPTFSKVHPCIFPYFLCFALLFQMCILVFFPYFSRVHPCIFPLFFKSASMFFPPIFQKCILFFISGIHLTGSPNPLLTAFHCPRSDKWLCRAKKRQLFIAVKERVRIVHKPMQCFSPWLLRRLNYRLFFLFSVNYFWKSMQLHSNLCSNIEQ